MGRMLKNTVARTGSHALGVPTGTSSIGPNPSTYGQMQYQTDANKMVYWGSNSSGTYGYYPVAREGNVTVKKDSYSGTGSQTLFNGMSYSYNAGQEAQVLIFVGQVYQNPGVAYTFNGNTAVTFTSAPSAGTNNILILHNFASTSAA